MKVTRSINNKYKLISKIVNCFVILPILLFVTLKDRYLNFKINLNYICNLEFLKYDSLLTQLDYFCWKFPFQVDQSEFSYSKSKYIKFRCDLIYKITFMECSVTITATILGSKFSLK